jgi:formate/nitrite transporter
MPSNEPPRLDAVLPPEMAERAEQVGVKKANMDAASTLVLAVLAGAFIALGGLFANVVLASGGGLPFGVARVLAGVVFSLGLILVVVGGAELFTGNNLIVMAWASRKIGLRALLRNWGIVYLGNLVGAVATAALVFLSGHYLFGGGAVGKSALAAAEAKAGLGFVEAVALGVLANALVCLAVWLTYSCRTTTDKVLVIVPPIAAFVACGFEHSVANMYALPVALFVKAGAPDSFWAAVGQAPADYPGLTWGNFLIHNLLPVTLGNVLGGSVLVGIVYWFVYLRNPADRGQKGRATGDSLTARDAPKELAAVPSEQSPTDAPG